MCSSSTSSVGRESRARPADAPRALLTERAPSLAVDEGHRVGAYYLFRATALVFYNELVLPRHKALQLANAWLEAMNNHENASDVGKFDGADVFKILKEHVQATKLDIDAESSELKLLHMVHSLFKPLNDFTARCDELFDTLLHLPIFENGKHNGERHSAMKTFLEKQERQLQERSTGAGPVPAGTQSDCLYDSGYVDYVPFEESVAEKLCRPPPPAGGDEAHSTLAPQRTPTMMAQDMMAPDKQAPVHIKSKPAAVLAVHVYSQYFKQPEEQRASLLTLKEAVELNRTRLAELAAKEAKEEGTTMTASAGGPCVSFFDPQLWRHFGHLIVDAYEGAVRKDSRRDLTVPRDVGSYHKALLSLKGCGGGILDSLAWRNLRRVVCSSLWSRRPDPGNIRPLGDTSWLNRKFVQVPVVLTVVPLPPSCSSF
jgi:hypothetical protein